MIRIKGNNGKGFTSRIAKIITGGVEKAGDDLLKNLKENTPVDSGYARSQWDIVKKEDNVEITNNAPYIDMLDNGHSGQAPNGIVKPALNNLKKRFKGYFKDN